MTETNFLLSNEERERFASYLEQQAESSKGMLEQFKKLPSAVSEILVARERRELAAYLTVAGILRSIESFTIN